MSMTNLCNPVGPFNTPLDENGNIIFTEELHGVNAVVPFNAYFNIVNNLEDDLEGRYFQSIPTLWPIITNDDRKFGQRPYVGFDENSADYGNQNPDGSYWYMKSYIGDSNYSNLYQDIGWALFKYERVNGLDLYGSPPYIQHPSPNYPERPVYARRILRTTPQFYDFNLFNNLNSAYDDWSDDYKNFFLNIDSSSELVDVYGDYKLPTEVYFWVKVENNSSGQTPICRTHWEWDNGSDEGEAYSSCVCNPQHTLGEVSLPSDACESNLCMFPPVSSGAYTKIGGGVNFRGIQGYTDGLACITSTEGGLTKQQHFDEINGLWEDGILMEGQIVGQFPDNSNTNIFFRSQQPNAYTNNDFLYTNDIHLAFDYKVGCPQMSHPAYNPDICFYDDEINAFGEGSYSNLEEICVSEDCNGSDIDIVGGQWSYVDACGQCNCGNYVLGNPEEQNTCLLPDELEDCYQDVNGDYCVDSQHDSCNVCSGDGLLSFEHEANSDDVGCGCFAAYPQWYFLDRDRDCQTNQLGIVVNAGGDGDDDCDVYLSGGKLFCRSFGAPTPNTCAFDDDFTAGEASCGWTPFQPFNYVDCNVNFPAPLTSELYPSLGYLTSLANGISGNCYFDVGSDQDEILSDFDSVEGCTDSNADNYNPAATFGINSEQCRYKNPITLEDLNVGDVVFKVDISTYIQPNLDDLSSRNLTLNVNDISISMTPHVNPYGYIAVLEGQSLGSNINYNYTITGEQFQTEYVLNEGISHDILVKSDIPTFTDLNYFNKFTQNVHKTNLPIFKIKWDLLNNDTSISIVRDEIDELVDVTQPDEGTQILQNINNFAPMFTKEDLVLKTSSPIDSLGLDEGVDWFLDSLSADKTLMKTALGLSIWKDMNQPDYYDFRFVDYYYSSTIDELHTLLDEYYYGINILRSDITEYNLIGYNVNDNSWVYEDVGDPFSTLPLNYKNFVDFYLLSEVTSNIDGINNAKIYEDGDGLLNILGPNVFKENSFEGSILPISEGTVFSPYRPIDLLDFSYDGLVFDYIQSLNDGVFSSFILDILDGSTDNYEYLFQRWNELRGGALSIDNITKKIDFYYDYLKNTSKFDNKRWRKLDYNNYETYKDVVDNLKEWLLKRIKWLDLNLNRYFGGSGNYIGYCNDFQATNYNPASNFNDGTCEYYSSKFLTFEVDMTHVNHPPVERVELEIIKKTMFDGMGNESYPLETSWKFKNVLQKFEMTNVRNDIWEVKIPLLEESRTQSTTPEKLYVGDYIEYHFIKHIPSVYNVETGAIEKDKSRFHLINYEKEITLSHYFNDFIDTLERTNLPIIKVDTINYNDFGPVTEDNPNLFYCPTYLLPNGYYADGPTDEICDMMKAYHDDPDLLGSPGAGYYITQEDCEIDTLCTVPCIDGTNPQDEPKIAGFMELIYNGENSIHTLNDEPQVSTKVGIEVRGFSSRGFPKKQYAVELQEQKAFPQCNDKSANYNLFCNGFNPEEDGEYNEDCVFTAENDFVLLGPYRDRVYVRNALTYELFDDMGHPSSNSKHIEFYLNGIYQGIFVVFEKPKIDSERMNVATTKNEIEPLGDEGEIQCNLWNSEQMSAEEFLDYCQYPREMYNPPTGGQTFCCEGGYVLKVESGGEQDFFIMDDGYTKVEYYDPKASKLSDAEKAFIRDKTLTAIYDTSNRLDQNSFVDYSILQELAKNNEGYTRSQYWYVRDIEPDKFYTGFIWDFNHAYGAVKSDTYQWAFVDFFAVGKIWADYRNVSGADLGDFAFLNQDENIEIYYDRWKSYRSEGGILDYKNLNDRINNLSEELRSLDSLSRDDARWFYSNNQDYEYEFSYFKTWLFSRLTWMDKWISPAVSENWGTSTSTNIGAYDSDSNNSFNDDYQKTFIIVTSPETNTIYDSDETKSVRFSWVTSLDLEILSNGFVYKPSDFGNTTQQFEALTGDSFLLFRIVNDITGEVVHTFSSQMFWGLEKVEFPEYIWNVSDIDDLNGSYYIEARYTAYESVEFENDEYYCTLDDVYTEVLCGPDYLNQYDLNGNICLSDEPVEDNPPPYILYDEPFYLSGIVGCISVGTIITNTDYLLTPTTILSDRVYFSIQNKSELQGCTDTFAVNFDVNAQIDDGSCKYQEDCDEKYILQRTDVDGLRTFNVEVGYNILSYPYPFADEDLNFFDVLNASYLSLDGMGFSEYDGITSHFEGNSYSAVFINGKWKSTNTEGFNIRDIKPGMGLILELQKPGLITWSIPQSERSE